MNHQPEELYSNLIKQITTAPSVEAVKQIVGDEMAVLEDRLNITIEKIKLADKMVTAINTLNPVYYGPEEWSNLKMARIHFNFLKSKMKMEAE